VHLFNITGHHLIFNYYIERSDNQLVQQLDNNQYSDEDLVELKVALHLPYMSNSEYARVDGEIEIDGKHYNYVKRKVSNDTLYVMCLPNTAKTKLFEARNNFNGQAADMNTSGKDNNSAAKKSQLLNEYNQCLLVYNFDNSFQLTKKISNSFTPQLLQPYLDSGFQPPDTSRA
jgi:hypothetical protein